MSNTTDLATTTVDAQGARIPALGFGTARMTGDECRRAVEHALEVGYRHVDTASMYENEGAVGDALAASEVDREDVFVVTKIHPDDAAYDDAIASGRRSLERLGIETIDLLLLHAPSHEAPLEETLDAMADLRDDGVVAHVGVSNFSVEQLDRSRKLADVPVVANQVKYHPYHHQPELLEYCHEHDVCLTAFSPLAEGTVPGDERLAAIGDAYDKSAAQVALRWLVQQPPVAAIPKASSNTHVEANAAIFDFELTDDEMAAVTDVGDGVWDRLAARIGLR